MLPPVAGMAAPAGGISIKVGCSSRVNYCASFTAHVKAAVADAEGIVGEVGQRTSFRTEVRGAEVAREFLEIVLLGGELDPVVRRVCRENIEHITPAVAVTNAIKNGGLQESVRSNRIYLKGVATKTTGNVVE